MQRALHTHILAVILEKKVALKSAGFRRFINFHFLKLDFITQTGLLLEHQPQRAIAFASPRGAADRLHPQKTGFGFTQKLFTN